MNTLNQIFLLNNINFVFTVIIVLMFIFVYLLDKQNINISFILVYILESVLLINLNVDILSKNTNINLELIFVLKLLWLILNINFIKFCKLKKIFLVIIYISGMLLTSNNIEIALVINLFSNSIIFYNFVYKNLSNINKEILYLEGKNQNLKKYISELNRDLEIEINSEKEFYKKEKEFYNMLDIPFHVANIPIFILKEKKLEYKNKQFEEIFNQTNLDDFNFEKFFKKNFLYGKNIVKEVNTKNDFLKLEITSFKEKIYELFVIDINNQNKNSKIFIFYDITNIYNMEQNIKFNKRSYRKLVEVLDDGIAVVDKNEIYYMNKKMKEIFEIKDEKEKIISIYELSNYIESTYKEEFIKNIVTNKFAKESKVWTTMTVENRFLKILENPLKIDNTKNLKLMIFSDITQNQNLLEDIAENEKIYRVLLENLPDGIIMINKTTNKYIYKNKYIIKALKEIGIEKFNKFLKDYIDEGKFDIVKEISLNKKEKASIIISNLKEQNIYIVIFKTEKNNLSIENQKNMLDKIEQDEAFKTKFYVDMIEKIEKPVNKMLQKNKIMEQKINYPIMDSHISLVRQNLYRLKKVLNNINYIMDIENNTYHIDYTVFDLTEVLNNIVNLSRDYINKKCLNLKLEFEEQDILVYLDPIKLQKIILNILSNAIKFIDKNGNIKISLERKIDFIVISIKDDGIGIPKDKIDFIFGSFNQIDKSLSRKAEGMGMGLYVAKKLSDIQGIYLNVESEINKGSEFKILIKNIKNPFLEAKYKKEILVDKEFIDIEYSDIYLN